MASRWSLWRLLVLSKICLCFFTPRNWILHTNYFPFLCNSRMMGILCFDVDMARIYRNFRYPKISWEGKRPHQTWEKEIEDIQKVKGVDWMEWCEENFQISRTFIVLGYETNRNSLTLDALCKSSSLHHMVGRGWLNK